MMKRMKIPLAGIRAKIRGEGNYQPKDIDLFATREEIEEANLSLLWFIEFKVINQIYKPYLVRNSTSLRALASA